MRSGVLLGLLLLAVLAGSAGAVDARNETRINVVFVHPFPENVPREEGGDPFGFAAPGGSTDWMIRDYGAYYYPTVRFDGVAEEANRPDSNPGSYVAAYRARVEPRLPATAAVSLALSGSLAGGNGTLDVLAVARENLSAEGLVLRVAVVEDGLRFPGTNGVDLHRFVARARFPDQPVAWTRDPAGTHSFARSFAFTVGAGHDAAPWSEERLGVVAWLQVAGEGARLAPQEVAQSATYLFAQEGPTVQVAKAVLLEVYTATWCEACVFGDGAVEVLLEEWGRPGPSGSERAHRYLRPPGGEALLLALALAVPFAWVATRRLP